MQAQGAIKTLRGWTSRHTVTVLMGSCLALSSANAAEAPTPELVGNDPTGSEPIEEVEIVGRRPLQFLIQDMERAEERMFDLFNALNDNSEFRVVCRTLMITGSRIPGRECVPVYIDRARKQSAQDFLQFGIPQKTEEEIWFETRHKQQEFNTKIRALAIAHPELAQSMFELEDRKQLVENYQHSQQARNKGWLGRLFSGERDEDE